MKELKFEAISGCPHTDAVEKRRVPLSCQHVSQAKRREEAKKNRKSEEHIFVDATRKHINVRTNAPPTEKMQTFETLCLTQREEKTEKYPQMTVHMQLHHLRRPRATPPTRMAFPKKKDMCTRGTR